MNISVINENELGNKAQLIAYNITTEDLKNIDQNLNFINKNQLSLIKNSIERKELNAKQGNTTFIPALTNTDKALLLIGTGEKNEEFSPYEIKILGANIVKTSKKLGFKSIAFSPRNLNERISNENYKKNFFNLKDNLKDKIKDKLKDKLKDKNTENTPPSNNALSSLTEGMTFANYYFSILKTNTKEKEDIEKQIDNIFILSNPEKYNNAVKEGNIIGLSINLARQLIDRPPNHCTPSFLAKETQKLEKEKNIKVSILNKKEIKQLNMNSFLSVAQGSNEEPKLIVIEYKPNNIIHKDKIALVGKGITFDTGGISLKPAKNMHHMKADMSGAACVIATMYAIAKLELNREVIGIIPSCENMPSSTAVKPGDVVNAMNGKTIEILNTDAEGRLILADALAYSSSVKQASHIIDIATLTGACMVALGETTTGLMTNDKNFAIKLMKACQESGESIWPLPLIKEYYKQIESDVADIANIGGPYAGTITAAIFLENFIDDKPWIHLDIAGPSWSSKKDKYYEKGATGSMISSIVKMLKT